MPLSIVIKDHNNKEYLEYKVSDFVAEFAEACEKSRSPWFGKNRRTYHYYKIAEKLINDFKRKTKKLPPDVG